MIARVKQDDLLFASSRKQQDKNPIQPKPKQPTTAIGEALTAALPRTEGGPGEVTKGLKSERGTRPARRTSMGHMEEIATVNSPDVSLPRAAAAGAGAAAVVVVDIVYGLPPDSSTGGCVVQRTFEDDLRAMGVRDIRLHVASTAESAEQVFERLQQQELEEAGGSGEGRPRVLIVDGIALLFLRHRLPALRSAGFEEAGVDKKGVTGTHRRRLLVGFVHCPFSQPFYCKEPWLRAAVTDGMLLGADARGLHDEEARLFGLLDKVIVVGSPCQLLLTADYGVAADDIILLEPTFPTPLPTAAATTDLAGAIDVDGSDANTHDRPGGNLFPSAPPLMLQLPSPTTGAPEAAAAAETATRAAARAAEAAAAAAAEAAAVAGEVSVPLTRALRFSSVGTLCPRKGQLELVEAFRAACDSHPKELGGSVLTLIGGEGGDPAYAGAVRAAAAAAPPAPAKASRNGGGGRLDVRLLGSLPHDQTLEIVAASDAFLLNSFLESWAVAPVEAALCGVPVLSTRVGTLDQSLPPKPTIWVGAERQSGGAGGGRPTTNSDGESAGGDVGCALASVADWKKALLQFAQDRRRLKIEAAQAVPSLVRRFGQAAVGSRARAVHALLETAEGGGCLSNPSPRLLPSVPRSVVFRAAGKLYSGVSEDRLRQECVAAGLNGSGRPNGSGHVNGSGLSNGSIRPNGSGHVNGSGLSNGSGLPNGSGHPNGSGLSNGSNRPNGSGRLNGSVHPNGSAHPNDPVHPDGSGHSNGFGDCCAESSKLTICSDHRAPGVINAAATVGSGSEDQERVRRATVMHALACVCATGLLVCGTVGAAGGLLGLVGAQILLLVALAPTPSPANVVTIFRSFIPPAVVWWKAGSDFGQVEAADVSAFGAVFVLLDVVDGALARRSKSGPTRVGAALDVESDSLAVLFLSLAASRKAWYGGFIAGILRYLFVIATGARELPPSPIGPAGRWLAKVAALASVAALALSIGGVHATADDATGAAASVATGRGIWAGAAAGAPSALPCAVGVAVLCASFSVDFYQIWVVLPREAVAAAAVAAEAGAAATATAATAAVTATDTSVLAVKI